MNKNVLYRHIYIIGLFVLKITQSSDGLKDRSTDTTDAFSYSLNIEKKPIFLNLYGCATEIT